MIEAWSMITLSYSHVTLSLHYGEGKVASNIILKIQTHSGYFRLIILSSLWFIPDQMMNLTCLN